MEGVTTLYITRDEWHFGYKTIISELNVDDIVIFTDSKEIMVVEQVKQLKRI